MNKDYLIKVTLAVYKVTGMFPNREPLRYQIRQRANEILAELLGKDKIYQAIRVKLQSDQNDEPGLPYWLMTLDFGLRQVKSALDWCESALKQYDKLEN